MKITIHTTSTKCQYNPAISTFIAFSGPSLPWSDRTSSVSSQTYLMKCGGTPAVPTGTWFYSELQALRAASAVPESR